MLDLEVDLLRYDAGLRRKIRALLDQLGRDLAREILESGLETPRTAWQRARLRELLRLTEEKVSETYGIIHARLDEEMRGLLEVSANAVVTACNAAIGAKLLQPLNWSAEQLAAIAGDVLIEGAPSAEWWSRQALEFRQAFADQMRQGMLRGETITQLRDRIVEGGKQDLRKVPIGRRDLIWTARRNAEALVRTSVLTTANTAHLQAFEANLDIVAGFQWVSTLDNRTTPICRALDGKVWSLPSYEPQGHGFVFPGPTAHWNCRSTQIAKTKTWEELARTNKDLARELDKIPRGQRASMGGPVSGDLTYEDWFVEQSEARQREILGSARYALWKDGKLGFTDMVDFRGRELTLDELKARFGL
jgi:SPP1 gp7 family putative phage head morphogenesis protein